MVIGLGGKATQMNRGRALREYVKNGYQTSEISIVLQNKGSDAFQSSKYGENITVERKLSANGAGSYKLKDEKGSKHHFFVSNCFLSKRFSLLI